MPIFGVSITKRVSFRGQTQEFSNVYHYRSPDDWTTTQATAVIAAVKGNEVALHSSDVTFVRGACWSSTGSVITSRMLAQSTLTGTGSQATNSNMDRERAVLVQWPAGVNIRGRPVYLRKWYHSCGNIASYIFTAANLQNTGAIADPDRAIIATAVNANTSIAASGTTGTLCAKSGRDNTGAGSVYKWLEHHQLGDMWR